MSSLIKAYGELWNPNIVNWNPGKGNTSELMGEIVKNNVTSEINFYKAKGIYVLYDNFNAIYVGKAFSTSIGRRLKDHLTDRFAGRWDMFSWYSTSTVTVGTNSVRAAGQRQLSPDTVINSLEALAILIADPALNRKREKFTDALEAQQSDSPHPYSIREYLEKILDKMEPSSS